MTYDVVRKRPFSSLKIVGLHDQWVETLQEPLGRVIEKKPCVGDVPEPEDGKKSPHQMNEPELEFPPAEVHCLSPLCLFAVQRKKVS